MHMPPASMPNESDKVVFLNKNVAADIIRLQGEELVKVRTELENAQNLNENAFQLFQATDSHIAELQDAILQRNSQMIILQETLMDLQRENDSFSASISSVRESLHDILNLRKNTPFPQERDDIGGEQPERPVQSTSTEEENQKLRREFEASLLETKKLREELNASKRSNEVLLIMLSHLSNGSFDSVRPEESHNPSEQEPPPDAGPSQINSKSTLNDNVSHLNGVELLISGPGVSVESSNEKDHQSSESTPSNNHATSSVSTASDTTIVQEDQSRSTAAGSLQLRFISGFTLLEPLIFSQSLDSKAIREICSKAMGYTSAKHVKVNPESLLIADIHNRNQAMLIVVSKGLHHQELSKECKQWKRAFVSIKGKNLYILGEYEHHDSLPLKLGLSEYELLPETAKDYVSTVARARKVKTKQDLMESLMKPNGLAVHVLPVQLVRSEKDLEELVIGEALQKGYQVTR